MKPVVFQSLLYSKCKYIEGMITASPCCWPPIPGIPICESVWRFDQGMDSAENYPGKNGSFSAGCEPFLRHSVAAGTLGRGRMKSCSEWTGQIHLEAVLVSAAVMCWWGIRAPAPPHLQQSDEHPDKDNG